VSARELYIVGTSGLAKEMAQLARQADPDQKRWNRFVFVAEDESRLGQTLSLGCIGLTDAELARLGEPAQVVIGVGYPRARRAIAQRLRANPALSFPNLIHPGVELDEQLVTLGEGNVITKGVVLTCDIQIGDFNLVNWNSTIGHDTTIGSYNVINPGASVSGRVVIGDGCMLGTGCRLLETLTVASETVIGAGAVVTRPIATAGTYVGVPARLLAN